tara:strand:+ start:65 stop:556 length:492 start_codon:yes stop_codon:yes gene_type:complete
MAQCSVSEWKRDLIGSPGDLMPTGFSTKMFNFGGDLVTKRMVKLSTTLNWTCTDTDGFSFTLHILYRTAADALGSYETWNYIDSRDNTIGGNTETGIVTTSGSKTFILPYGEMSADNEDYPDKTSFKGIQFYFAFNLNNNTSCNLSINDISLMYRKFRDYGSE